MGYRQLLPRQKLLVHLCFNFLYEKVVIFLSSKNLDKLRDVERLLQAKVFFTLLTNIVEVFVSFGWLAIYRFSFLENISINTANIFIPNFSEETDASW